MNPDTNKFRGTGVALVTPFLNNGAPDMAALKKLIDHVIDGGVEYVVSMGTTGEAATLNEAERFAIMEFTIDQVGGRIPVVCGFGGNDTAAIIQSIRSYAEKGKPQPDALLIASPYYNRPSQEGIYRHYMAIDAAVSTPVILYNVPGRTASNMEAATTLRIAQDAKHIIAIKEASGNFSQCMQIVRDAPEDFLIVSGDDAITLPFISIGMHGVISVVANACPKLFSNMVRFALNGNYDEARKLHYRLLEFTDLLFKEGSPAGVKAALTSLGIGTDTLRLPLWNISDSLAQKIRSMVIELQD